MGKQEIEIAYKKYTSLNTWVTLIKQKLNYSQYIEQEQDTLSMSRTLSLLEKYAVIQIEFFNIYINVTNDIPPPPPPPLSNHVFVSSHLPVFESFPKLLVVNSGMPFISVC